MTNQTKPRREPWQVVMDQLAGGTSGALPLDKHLNGCLAGYQESAEHTGKVDFGVATFFALEAIWGIVNSLRHEAAAGNAQGEADSDWVLPPLKMVGVPWLWLVALAEAWERSDHGKMPIGVKSRAIVTP